MADSTPETRLASLRDTYTTLDGVQERADPMVAPYVAKTADEVWRQIEELEERVEGDDD